MKNYFLIFFLIVLNANAQSIGEFTSVFPNSQNSDFIIPSSHTFQKIIIQDDPLTAGGTLPRNTDFTGYVPIAGSSENGYLSINAEIVPGAVSILDINYNPSSKLWATSYSQAVDFSPVVLTVANCSGTVTPWNTIISCEEYTSQEVFENYPSIPVDSDGDGYHDLGWAVEIDPSTKTVIDKRWALGNFKHENLVIHNNERTAYQGADAQVGYLYKFVADNPRDLSSGKLFVYKGEKNGPGNWILLNNTTKNERNTTVSQSANVGGTVFKGIEDVEIGPDGYIYFAVKSEDRVYRFQDSDPVSGTTVINMETYVGNTSYPISHSNGTSFVNWGYGNDNLAFDGDGNLWVMNDGANNYIWVVKNGHTQANPKVEIFGIVPSGAEPTGITFSPDYRFLFMSIQHPNSNNNSTTQTDAAGNEISFNKSTSLVIALNEHLGNNTEYVWYLDSDGDGYAIEPTVTSATSPGPAYTLDILPLTDCDDNDASVFEVTTWYLDADGDGHSTGDTVESCSSPGNGYVQSVISTSDCDDADASVYQSSIWYVDADGDGYTKPDGIESCGSPGMEYSQNASSISDCDDTDASVFQETTWYLDTDGDGHSTGPSVESCSSPGNGYVQSVISTSDCDDADASVYQSSIWYVDADGDGYTKPDGIESCGSPGMEYSQNASSISDCDDTDASVFQETTWYLDTDGDGHSTGPSVESCSSPGNGYVQSVISTSDCDDADASVYQSSIWYVDADGDGYTKPDGIESCGSPGMEYSQNASSISDCDDTDASVFQETTWYLDTDGDGHSTGPSVESCSSPGNGYVQSVISTSDCDDADASVYESSIWYVDADGDGYTAPHGIESCGSPGMEYSQNASTISDCDDTDELINPETIWFLDSNMDGIADDEKFIIDCDNPGIGYTNSILIPFSNEQKILLYPNPTTESIEIDLGEIVPDIELTIVNSSKQLVFKKTFQNQRILTMDLATLASGMYYLELYQKNNTIWVQKIIKQ